MLIHSEVTVCVKSPNTAFEVSARRAYSLRTALLKSQNGVLEA